jgi:hypothetical protein
LCGSLRLFFLAFSFFGHILSFESLLLF